MSSIILLIICLGILSCDILNEEECKTIYVITLDSKKFDGNMMTGVMFDKIHVEKGDCIQVIFMEKIDFKETNSDNNG